MTNGIKLIFEALQFTSHMLLYRSIKKVILFAWLSKRQKKYPASRSVVLFDMIKGANMQKSNEVLSFIDFI